MPYTKWPDNPHKMYKFPICGQVEDIFGTLWNVRETRLTKHGFDLQFGNVTTEPPTGLPRIIPTRELIRYWEDNATNYGATFDLPAGRTTLKRVRTRFGFNVLQETRRFYADRIHDLRNLRAAEFAERHNVTKDCANAWRLRLTGRIARPLDWWRTPETIALLLTTKTHREVGKALGIGTSHAFRLRLKARADYANPVSELLAA